MVHGCIFILNLGIQASFGDVLAPVSTNINQGSVARLIIGVCSVFIVVSSALLTTVSHHQHTIQHKASDVPQPVQWLCAVQNGCHTLHCASYVCSTSCSYQNHVCAICFTHSSHPPSSLPCSTPSHLPLPNSSSSNLFFNHYSYPSSYPSSSIISFFNALLQPSSNSAFFSLSCPRLLQIVTTSCLGQMLQSQKVIVSCYVLP